MMKKISPQLKQLIATVKGKRARAVIDHILKHGLVTTEDLESMGYAHAPRAARDVRENGVPLKTVRVKGKSGKSIAAYEFDDSGKIFAFKLGGRKMFSKAFKALLVEKYGMRCALCNEQYEDIYLQIDHKIPYEVAGDVTLQNHEEFMLVCASCNRKKSWSCEQCPNWLIKKDPNACKTCFWANPENFKHIATDQIRRTELIWRGSSIKQFEKIKKQAKISGLSVQDYIKNKLQSNKDGEM